MDRLGLHAAGPIRTYGCRWGPAGLAGEWPDERHEESGWLGGGLLVGLSVVVVAMPDRDEPAFDDVELTYDHVLDVGVQPVVGTEDELTESRHQRAVFLASKESFRPGGEDHAGIIGEIGRFDHAHPQAGLQAMTCSGYCSCSSRPGS